MKTPEWEYISLSERDDHRRALETLRAANCKKNGNQLWRSLDRLERSITSTVTSMRNGTIDSDHRCQFDCDCFDKLIDNTKRAVTLIFGKLPDGFTVNVSGLKPNFLGDYSLKIDNCQTIIPDGLHTDWNGCGCLAF